MKKYNIYKSSTLKTINLIGNSNIVFDIANKNKKNIVLSTNIYTSKYKNFINLDLLKVYNDNNITQFGRGVYLNTIYTITKISNDEIKLVYPGNFEENFIKNGDRKNLIFNENGTINSYEEYFYSENTSNILTMFCDSEKTIYYIYHGGNKVEFIDNELSTLHNTKIYLGSNSANYVTLVYNENNELVSLYNSEKTIEKVKFERVDSYKYKLKAYKDFELNFDGEDLESINKLISTIEIAYTTNYDIESIKQKETNCTVFQKNILFRYGSYYCSLIIEDQIKNISESINFGGTNTNGLSSNLYVESINLIDENIIISYVNDYFTTISINNRIIEYAFNMNYDLLHVRYPNGYVQSFNYEIDGKYNLISSSKLLKCNFDTCTNKLEESFFSSNMNFSYYNYDECPGGSIYPAKDISYPNNKNQETEYYIKSYYNKKGSKFDVVSFLIWFGIDEIVEFAPRYEVRIEFLKNNIIVNKMESKVVLYNECFATNNNWQFYSLSCQANDNYDQIVVNLKPLYYSDSTAIIKYCLIDENVNEIYEYDEKGNVKKFLVGNQIKYNGFNKNDDISINSYKVNSYNGNKMIYSVDKKHVSCFKKYDSYNNLLEEEVKDNRGNIIDELYIYDEYKNLAEINTKNNEIIKEEYDPLSFEKTKTEYNLITREYSYNHNNDIHYGSLSSITHKYDSDIENKEKYLYDKQNLLSMMHTRDLCTTQYRFERNAKGRVTEVYCSSNDEEKLLLLCTYNSIGELEEEYINYDFIQYIKNERNLLNMVKVNADARYLFQYNDNNLVTYVDNVQANYQEVFEYNDISNIKKIKVIENSNNCSEDVFGYNTNNECNVKNARINNQYLSTKFSSSLDIKDNDDIVSFEYDLLKEEDKDLYFTMFNKRLKSYVVGEEQKYCDISTTLINKDSSINAINLFDYNEANNYLFDRHGFNMLSTYKNTNLGNIIYPSLKYLFDNNNSLGDYYSIFFGIQLSSYQDEVPFFHMISDLSKKSEFMIYNKQNILYFVSRKDGANNVVKTYSISEFLNKLHYFAINVSVSELSNNYFNYIFDVYLDGVLVCSISSKLNSSMKYLFFMGKDFSEVKEGLLSSIIVNKNRLLFVDKINYYINKLNTIYEKNDACHTSFKQVINNHNIEYDFIPFNGSLDSVNGIKPKLFKTNSILTNYDENFEYEKKVCNSNYGNKVYACRNQELEYDLGLSLSGTIAIRYKEVPGKYTTVVQLLDSTGFEIIAHYNNAGVLFIEVNGDLYQYIEEKEHDWNTIVISWSKQITGYSIIGNVYNVKVTVNEITILSNEVLLENDLSNMLVRIGKAKNNINQSSDIMGYIENLIFTDTYHSSHSKFVKMLNEFSTNKQTFDLLGRRTETITTTSKNINIENKYHYLTFCRDDRTLSLTKLNKETIFKDGYLFGEYVYNYDLYNRISLIKDSTIQNTPKFIRYIYDNKNQLIEEVYSDKAYVYEYDVYGNIKSVKKDGVYIFKGECNGLLLTKSNSKSIQYHGFYPTEIYDINNNLLLKYVWDTNKLSSIYDYEKKVIISYKYNYNGNRIYKQIINMNNNAIIKKVWYYYNVNNLLSKEKIEVYTNSTLQATNSVLYMYDCDGNMYGFSSNGINYYYVKDALGRIKGYLDENGNVCAKYEYTAYGLHTTFDANGNVINDDINNILFKGYYYDVETNLFLVTSRYYSPELGRFI